MNILIDYHNCMSIKNSKEINIQCPYKKKYGDYCGHHRNGKCKKRIDDILITNETNSKVIKSIDYFNESSYKDTHLELLKNTAKSIGLTLKKISKRLLYDNIYNHFNNLKFYNNNIQNIIKIQAVFRGSNIMYV